MVSCATHVLKHPQVLFLTRKTIGNSHLIRDAHMLFGIFEAKSVFQVLY